MQASNTNVELLIPASLPVLDALLRSEKVADCKPFSGYQCIIIHHLLGSVVPLLSALEAGGLRRSDIFIVGKAYSSHRLVVTTLEAAGYDVTVADQGYSRFVAYESILEQSIKSVLRRVCHRSMPVLLLDDAGKGILTATIERLDERCTFKGVELTSRGAHLLQRVAPSFPVINVARSWAKTVREAPIIADSMVTEFVRRLAQWESHLNELGRAGFMIGYGCIGQQVCTRLRALGFDMSVFDVNPSMRGRAAEDGFMIAAPAAALGVSDLIIGCSGTEALDITAAPIKKGALLVNMASSDLEFMPWNAASFSEAVDSDSSDPDREPWRHLFRVKVNSQNFFLANGGFPVDFSGAVDPIPPRRIQLTRALLFAGALQAVGTAQTGLQELSSRLQEMVLSAYDADTREW